MILYCDSLSVGIFSQLCQDETGEKKKFCAFRSCYVATRSLLPNTSVASCKIIWIENLTWGLRRS